MPTRQQTRLLIGVVRPANTLRLGTRPGHSPTRLRRGRAACGDILLIDDTFGSADAQEVNDLVLKLYGAAGSLWMAALLSVHC